MSEVDVFLDSLRDQEGPGEVDVIKRECRRIFSTCMSAANGDTESSLGLIACTASHVREHLESLEQQVKRNEAQMVPVLSWACDRMIDVIVDLLKLKEKVI